jgi:hypothetical protein
LDGFARVFGTAKAAPAAERQPRLEADDSQRAALTATAPEVSPPGRDDASIKTIRRSVGRPRKTVATAPAPPPNKTGGKATASDEIIVEKTGKLNKLAQNRPAAEQEPVQWWVEGWNGRRS